jgi:hypothetical protein
MNRPMRRVALALGVVVLGVSGVAACNLVFGIDERTLDPSLDDGGSESGVPDAAPFVIGQPSCLGLPAPLDGGACSVFESLDASVVLDGIGNEYCNLHATSYLLTDGQLVIPPPRHPYSETARFFAAWTSEGLAMHVHVTDPVVIATNPPQNGDSLTFFLDVLPSSAAVTATPTHSIVVTVSPQTATQPAHAVLVMDTDSPIYHGAVGRQVTDGWEVELLALWSDFKMTTAPNPARTDALFDLAVRVLDDPDASDGGGPELISYFVKQKPDGGMAAGCRNDPSGLSPSCDARTWCEAILGP